MREKAIPVEKQDQATESWIQLGTAVPNYSHVILPPCKETLMPPCQSKHTRNTLNSGALDSELFGAKIAWSPVSLKM
jgi:hypothetical protein